MKTRTDYFRRRRLKLRRRHMCTRCGCEPHAPQKKLCPSCLAVNAAKKEAAIPAERAKEEKRQRLLARLDLIEQARVAVLGELDRVA